MTKYIWTMGVVAALAVVMAIVSCGKNESFTRTGQEEPYRPPFGPTDGEVDDDESSGEQEPVCAERRSCGECTLYVSKDKKWAVIDCGEDGTRKIRLHKHKGGDDDSSSE